MDIDTQNAVRLVQELVRIESTNPGKMEEEIGAFVLERLSEARAETEVQYIEEGRPIVRGVLRGRQEHPSLIFLCHMDTVVVGDGWTESPFGGELKDGRLWGRGACDMKSGLGCALHCFCKAVEACRSGRKEENGKASEDMPKTLCFIGTSDEEGEMRGVEKAISLGWIKDSDWVLDMEPTDGKIQMAHKGRSWYRLLAEGVTAHASMPDKGVDAIAGMAFMIAEIRKKIGRLPPHRELGRTTVTFGQIRGGYSPYVVPDRCEVTIDMRTVPPLDTEGGRRIIEEAASLAKKYVPGINGKVTVTGDRPALETVEDSPLLKMLALSAAEVTGETAEITPFTGYTDTAVVAGKTGNKNCMSYGPGSLAQAHKPNEYVEISEIARCVKVYDALIRRFLFG